MNKKNNGVNSNCKYNIRGFKRHLPGDFAVAVAVAIDVVVSGVLYFLLLIC